jgi:NADH dehydrogenase
MILLTGATGTVGRPLLARLLGAGFEVRCFVREPRRLGPNRVQVQIAIGDLARYDRLDRAMRGVETVIHLGATTRDQARGTIEEINGVATLRLLSAARRAGVQRFVQITAPGASVVSPSRLICTQALVARAVRQSGLESVAFEAGIIYAPEDPWMRRLRELIRLPVMPVIGDGSAQFQPIWADDAADAVTAVLLREITTPDAPIALAGPQVLSHDQILRIAMRHFGRQRPLLHLPKSPARRVLRRQERRFGQAAPVTWDQVALLQESALSSVGDQDLEALGVSPLPIADVLPPN